MREFGEQHCWQKGKHQQRCEDMRTQEYGEMQYTGDQKQISITRVKSMKQTIVKYEAADKSFILKAFICHIKKMWTIF